MRTFRPWIPASLAACLLFSGWGAIHAAPIDQQIDAIFRTAHENGKFNGTVLVMRKKQTIYEQSFGSADLEKKIANGPETRFPAFSILKTMTAVLVFQQIEAGRLQLTNSLDSFFPNLAGKPAGSLTLQQLLTHTSGISEVISDHRDRRITPQDLESATVKATGEFEYSNTAYVCLALVLETATGRSYESLFQERILDPAGMKDSGLLRTGRTVPGLAKGYQRKAGRLTFVGLNVAVEALDGAGSLYTTTRDLWRFDQALLGEKILSRKMQQLMLTPQVKDRYAFGWFLSEQNGRYFPWHKGEFNGYASVLVRQIHREEVIVILSNLDECDVLELRTKTLRVLKAYKSL
ncbi:MAG: serine hydrolase domain-containing protein [Nibricoccus sp.]